MANTVAIVSLLVIIPAFALFLAFSALTAYVVYLHWIYRHLPGPKRDSFFFGNIPFIEREKEGGKTIFDIFTDQHRVYGPVVLMWAYYNPFTSVSDPEMVRKCLLTLNLPKNPRTYRNISFVFGHRVAGNGVLTEINHEAWQKRREILNPAFHRRYLMNLMSALNSICDDFLAKIDELADGKTTVNMAEEFNRVTLDVIGKVAFNVELGTIRDANSPFPLAVLRCLEGIQQSYTSVFWRISVSMFPFQRSVIEATKFIRSFGKKVIEERQEAIRKGEETPHDILAHILSEAEKHSNLTTEDLVDDFVTFFIAGQETTSNQLAFTLYEVLKHPEVERRILQEIDEVLGSRHYVTYMELGALQYLGQTLKEGLRLHPPIGGFTRITVEQENIGGYVFPARTPVNLSSFVVHRIPNAWQAPDEFDPDRFSPASISGISRAAFFPFSLGPRSCIGQTLAQFEARVLMARLLQEFELKLLPGQDPLQHNSNVTLRPKGGVWCVINRRNYCTHSKGFCR